MRDRSSLSPEDLDTVVRTVIGEAIGEGRRGMEAVAAVIKNRAEDIRGTWPNTAAGVSRQPAQFSTWNSPRAGGNTLGRTTARGSGAYKGAEEAVLGIFSGKTPDPTRGATHYYAPGGMPGGRAPGWWGGVSKERGSLAIGGHRFAGQVQRASPAAATVSAYAAPSDRRGASAAIGGLLGGSPSAVPTPTAAPRGLLSQAPVPANVPTPVSSQRARTGNTLTDRFAGAPLSHGWPQGPLDKQFTDRYAATRPTPNSPVTAPQPSTAPAVGAPLTAAQTQNLASRLGPVEASRSATTIGGLLGVTPAAAATMTPDIARANQQIQAATAAPTRQMSSPRALEAMGAPRLDPVAQAPQPPQAAPSLPSLPSRDVATRSVTPAIEGPIGRTSAPTGRASAPAGIAPGARATGMLGANVGYTPDRPVSGMAFSGDRGNYATSLPSAPAAPTQGLLGGLGNWASNNRGMIAGGLIGGTAAGPLGMVVGGLLGRSMNFNNGDGGGQMSAGARAATDAGWGGFGPMTGAQERAARTAQRDENNGRGPEPSQAAKEASRSGKGGLF